MFIVFVGDSPQNARTIVFATEVSEKKEDVILPIFTNILLHHQSFSIQSVQIFMERRALATVEIVLQIL